MTQLTSEVFFRMPGRTPTLIDVGIASRVLAAVQNGKKQAEAAKAGGISRWTIMRALQRGRREPNSFYAVFAKAYAEAEETWRRQRIAERRAAKENANRP